MNVQPSELFEVAESGSSANGSYKFLSSAETRNGRYLRSALVVITALMSAFVVPAQDASPHHSDGATIQGSVHDSAYKPVGDAWIRLEKEGVPGAAKTKTNGAGIFAFSALQKGSYVLSAEKSGLHSRPVVVISSTPGDRKQVDLFLEDSAVVHTDFSAPSPSSTQAMEFTDRPNFTVAGVTDWTAAGGHGSDSSLRTSEALTRETLKLKSEDTARTAGNLAGIASAANISESKLRAALANAPGSFEANHQLGEFYLHARRYREAVALLGTSYRIDPANYGNEYDLALACKESNDVSQARDHVQKLMAHQENADVHRLAGELDETVGDPLGAVHEYEQAVRLDPNEQNYFEWGSELLLHRAVWQAQEVFRKGAEAHPRSARMLTAWATALFAGALYDEAALRLCSASDLNPTDPEPYIFMGKIEMAVPKTLACVEQKLARFVHEQSENSLANYLYAMAIWKRLEQPPDPRAVKQVETFLTKAVTIDPKCGDAYLQLGILYSSQRNFLKAVGSYKRAIEANPQLGEAHYRLGVAYDRLGEPAKAKQEFQLHEEIEKLQAAAVERQRREVKQFLVVLPGQPNLPAAPPKLQ